MSKNNKLPSLSIVLSFYNEQNVLNELIKRLRVVNKSLLKNKIIASYKLIFVNDASTDNSQEIIKKALSKGDIKLINMSRNFGVSECVIAGFENANTDLVIYMDADLQDPPEIIPSLIDAWISEDDVEVVYTTRTKRYGEPKLKMMITKLGYKFINLISDINLEVESGDFKLLSKKAISHILELKEKKPYLRGLSSWIGFKQKQVFYERDPRFDGHENTKMKLFSRKVIFYWVDRALISFSDGPLKIILFFGMFASLISFLYIIFVIIDKFNDQTIPGWAALMSATLFLGSLNILMLGIVGLYISTIFNESKNRPRYIIKDIIEKQ